MKFQEQKIKGVWVVEAEPAQDSRGALCRHFCQNEYKEMGLDASIVQTNISENYKMHTLRGFHYQVKPFEESKTITCLKGAMYDVIVDVRPDSETYLQWLSFELTAGDRLSLYIPKGCANGYMTLEDSTTILYYMSEFYAPTSYVGFRYNDPLFKVKWPAEPAVISGKDDGFKDFVPTADVP